MSMSEHWPISFQEANLEETVNIRPEDIASYANPPGRRERYTEAGWDKFMRIMIDVEVHPALEFHDRGCVKRYGLQSEALCTCERRLAHQEATGHGE
jgi:hypothetical protein